MKENNLGLASTNLNICAIYSNLGKHSLASQYAFNSIGYAERVMKKYLDKEKETKELTEKDIDEFEAAMKT